MISRDTAGGILTPGWSGAFTVTSKLTGTLRRPSLGENEMKPKLDLPKSIRLSDLLGAAFLGKDLAQYIWVLLGNTN